MSRLPGPRTPLGHLLWGVRMLRSPYTTLMALQDRYGPIVKVGMGPLAFVYLLGRDANEMILNTNVNDFSWRDAFASLIPLEGNTALVVTDGPEHDRRRRLVQPAFGIRRIRSYGPVVSEEIDRTLRRWSPGDHIDLHTEMKRTVRRIAIRSLFGDHLGERAEELAGHLQAAIDFANLPPLPGRDLNLAFSPYRRAMRARARADAVIYAEIDRRRSSGSAGDDLLGDLLTARDVEGELTDEELRDQTVSLIAAGYETTAALVSWAVYATLLDPEVEQRLRAELTSVFGAGQVSEERISDCTYLQCVIQETLRLHSPAGVSGRKAEADVDFGGHTIKAGAFVIYSPYVTHRQPQHWRDPTAFQPGRWIGPDGGLLEPPLYTFVPFGGGYRRCIGFAMATFEAQILVAATLHRSELRLERRNIAAHGLATVAPKGGIPITVIAVDPA